MGCAVITACVSVSICFRLDLHTVARPVLHRCETGALFHVLVILGAAVLKFIHSPFFLPLLRHFFCRHCCPHLLLHWLHRRHLHCLLVAPLVHCFLRFAYNHSDLVSSSCNKKQTRVSHVLAYHHPCFML